MGKISDQEFFEQERRESLALDVQLHHLTSKPEKNSFEENYDTLFESKRNNI
jgi:hypothetical protein